MTDSKWIAFDELGPKHINTTILVRGRIDTVRPQSKMVFVVLRQGPHTLQTIAFKKVAAHAADVVAHIPRESIVDVKGTLIAPPAPVHGVTISHYELHISAVAVVSEACETPVFAIDDAARPDSTTGSAVAYDLRLQHRFLDLRTATNQAIARVVSTTQQLFREFVTATNFIEIHTPKILGGVSEGGAAVFKLDYFGRAACLAQSPQLYKQVCAACGDLGRVFEIGPVFRAENAHGRRHLCEFVGMDIEMTIDEHYYEVMDMLCGLFSYMFDGLEKRCGAEIATVRRQYPAEPFVWSSITPLRITYTEGLTLLKEHAGRMLEHGADLSSEDEAALGRVVKTLYGTDFFMMDKYPLSVRPFYTMPCPDDPTLSNSYDMFVRGEEVLSGAQRIHDFAQLEKRVVECGVAPDTLRSYLDAFKVGAYPHGGGGIGLERFVMLYLGLPNIRLVSLFPRDPVRLTP